MGASRTFAGAETLDRGGANFSSLWGADAGAVAVWVYVPLAAALPTSSAPYNLAGLAGRNTSANIGLFIGGLVESGTTTDYAIMYYFAGGTSHMAKIHFTRGEWNLIIGEFSSDAGGTLRITATSPSQGRLTATTTANGTLPGGENLVFGDKFVGSIDEISVYNRLLTDVEKMALYEGVYPAMPGLTAKWLLDVVDSPSAGLTPDAVGVLHLSINATTAGTEHNQTAVVDPNIGTVSTIEALGCVITLSAAMAVSKYAGGIGYKVVVPASVNITAFTIAALETAMGITAGGIMINPTAINEQGWNGDLDSGTGPGTWYNAALNHSLPITVNPTSAGGPVCVAFYAKTPTFLAGQHNNCSAILVMCFEAMDRGTDAIMPAFLGAAASKRLLTMGDDVDLTAIDLISKPPTANEPFWNADYATLKWPYILIGNVIQPSTIAPQRTQNPYPTTQAKESGHAYLGAVASVASQATLAARVITQALAIEAYRNIRGTACIGIGGYGYGHWLALFLTSFWTDDASLRAIPTPIAYTSSKTPPGTVAFFAEHDCFIFGYTDPDNQEATRIPLHGDTKSTNYPTGPYGDNHSVQDTVERPRATGDVAVNREPQWLPSYVVQLPAQTGGSGTVTLPNSVLALADATRIEIVSGTGDGQQVTVQNFSAMTHRADVVEWSGSAYVPSTWTTPPDATSIIEIQNGGAYTANAIIAELHAAFIVFAIDKVEEAGDELLPMLLRCQQWMRDDDGLLAHYPLQQYLDGSDNERIYADPEGTWLKAFVEQYAFLEWDPDDSGGEEPPPEPIPGEGSMELETRINMSVVGLGTKVVGLDIVHDPLNEPEQFIWANGTGANQANKSYHVSGTIVANDATSIVLKGDGLTPNTIADAFADVVELARLKYLRIKNTHATQPLTISGNLLGITVGGLPLRPGGVFEWINPDATGVVLSYGTANQVTLSNGSGSSVTYNLIAIGTQ